MAFGAMVFASEDWIREVDTNLVNVRNYLEQRFCIRGPTSMYFSCEGSAIAVAECIFRENILAKFCRAGTERFARSKG